MREIALEISHLLVLGSYIKQTICDFYLDWKITSIFGRISSLLSIEISTTACINKATCVKEVDYACFNPTFSGSSIFTSIIKPYW